jgi:beta-phosphoglucomutase-like phosphatase (HAD superfamily)
VGVREAVTALLLDFDGTMVDTNAAWTRATRACFAARGFDLDERMLSLVASSPWCEVIPGLSLTDAAAVEFALIEAMRAAYLDCPPAAGLRAFLHRFAGTPKAIVTSSYREQLVEPYLHRHDLDRYFPVVVGSEDTELLKPSPEPVLLALRRLGTGPGGAWLIGDSTADMEAARLAGVRSVGFGGRPIGGDLAADSFETVTGLLTVPEHVDGPQ